MARQLFRDKFRIGWLLLPGLWLFMTTAEGQTPASAPYEHLIVVESPREQPINPWIFSQWRRVIEESAAKNLGRTALVLMIDSNGGDVQAARDIVALIQSHSENEALGIYAWIPERALSAAAWIALSARGIFIAPDAVFGDIQPIIGDFRGYERVPEKIVTALAEEIWLDCRQNGAAKEYPKLFVEAMVDKDIELVAAENQRQGTVRYLRAEDFDSLPADERSRLTRRSLGTPGKALTTNGRDLFEFGFGVELVQDRFALVDRLGNERTSITTSRITRPSTWDVLLNWRWLLVAAGIVFLIIEMKTPGIGIFGVLSILCFIAFFLAEAGWTDRTLIAVGMLLVGMFLLVMEIMVLPGFGVFGISGILLVLASTWVAVAEGDTNSIPLPSFSDDESSRVFRNWAMMVSGSLLGGFAGALLLGRTILHLPILRQLVLVPPRVSTQPSVSQASDTPPLASIGETGLALTDLRPSGTARIGSRKVDVISRGDYVAADTPIEVIEVSGNHVVVRPKTTGGPVA